MAIDLEGTADEPPRPDVLVEDEVGPIQPPERDIPFMDSGREQVVVTTPHGLEPLDGVLRRTDQVVDDGIVHRGEDRLDIAVMLGPQLGVDEPIEFRVAARSTWVKVLTALHKTHYHSGR